MNPSIPIPLECQLCTAEQSREMDRTTIENLGIDGFTLMEIAASSAANHIKNLQGDRKSGLFVCGKGNNAGDALAVARYLINESHHSVKLYFVLGKDDLSADAEKNLNILHEFKDHGSNIELIDSLDDLAEERFDYIVDGIFGTGLNSNLRGSLPEIVNKVNSFTVPVYSMDVPSGLHADTGTVLGGCIEADYTFTFGSNKLGLHWENARNYTGKVIFNDLPFPSFYRKREAVLINQKLVKNFPDIKRNAKHKYDGGVVHILAGSEGLTGAAIMSAKSAWKQGAGSVFLYAPKALLPIYETTLPHVIKVGVGKHSDSFFKEDHIDQISENIQAKEGILLAGPGVGRNEKTGNCLIELLKKQNGFVILDADALSFWEQIQSAGISYNYKSKWLLTPHIGEAKASLGANFSTDYERYRWSNSFSEETKCSILMKGNPAILSFNDGEKFITGYDTSIFSRAGFGDVLSGALAANISISGNKQLAAVKALFDGFEKYQKFNHHEAFGPEHLL